ncbi:MAG: DUF2225 domain-containing protein [Deltaproteobacteria bacterium]|nr:DUF2225 domain-containing protein [Deltaproteobacteria bacterium]
MRLAPVILAAALSLPAWGARMATRVAHCPLDGAEARTYVQISSNTLGGWDSDLASYASHGQWREYAITTCPKDYFTLLGTDFETPRDEATLARLREVAREVQAEVRDPTTLETWDRYAIAARFYRALGSDEAFVGGLYLTASWLARDRAVGEYLGLEGPKAARETLKLGEAELARALSNADRKKVTYNLARVAERLGDASQRDRYLDAFATLGLDDAEREALARFRLMVGTVEPRFQDLAIAEYRAYLGKPGRPPAEAARVTYLLADLLRRRGRAAEAVPLYRQAADDPASSEQIRDLARTMLEGL